MKLPKHSCGLYLEHNPHKDYYETVEEFTGDDACWKTESSRQNSIDTNELWLLQWYPLTPIGFCRVYAPTLEELLEFALEVEARG